MKFFLHLFFLFSVITCQGQEKKEKSVELNKITDSEIYEKQNHHIEFKGHQMFYNGEIIKLGKMSDVVKIFGRQDFIDYGTVMYYSNPISISAHFKNKLDKYGNYLVNVDNKEFPINDSEGKRIEENWRSYIDNNGKNVYEKDKNGNLVGDIYTYRLWMSPYESTSLVMNEADSARAKIPALNGYIKINGKLIHQSITKKELQEKLYPLPEGGQLTGMLGDPVLIYELGKEYKTFDPNMDPSDTRVFIDIVFKTDPKTKEEKGIYYINYYYALKEKD